MVSMPYLVFAVISFKVYRGFKAAQARAAEPPEPGGT